MGTSIIHLQRDVILSALRGISGDDWKILVVDRGSRKLIDNVTKEDDVLNANITNIDQIEDRRQPQPDTDAIYLLSPLARTVEILKADLDQWKYRKAFLIWTSVLPYPLFEDLRRSNSRWAKVADCRSLNIEFYPRESNVITFREPESFQILFNPTCDGLIRDHLSSLTQKVVSVCVSLGEYPVVKYYRPRNPRHDAAVLCSHLASFVQEALDEYARDRRNRFPPESPRPRATLIITDRSMDLMAPLVHELTYQAMAMDLLPIEEINDKVIHKTVIKRGQPDQDEKDIELSDKDKIWVENRHLHMKDLLLKLSSDFKKFMAKNPQFAGMENESVSVNTIKDMLAGLPEFQEGKEAFSLHIDMAERCAKIFQDHNMIDLISVEQSLSTRLDEDNRPPKNLADQIVRLLDDANVNRENRLRLLILYILYRDGILAGDIEKLRQHGELSQMDSEIIYNLDALGARVQKDIKEVREPAPAPGPLFPIKVVKYVEGEEMSLSRYEPVLKQVLEAQASGTLDNRLFPPVKADPNEPSQQGPSQASLRSAAQPTWAKGRGAAKPKQRVIVFMAGGATYSEARACYEASQQLQKEVYLATSDMLSPKMFLRQVSLISAKRRQLRLPADREPPPVPSWMLPPQADPMRSQTQGSQRPVGLPSGPGGPGPRPPVNAMHQMSLNPQGGGPQPRREPSPARVITPVPSDQDSGKAKKDKKEKKHGFGGMFKKN